MFHINIFCRDSSLINFGVSSSDFEEDFAINITIIDPDQPIDVDHTTKQGRKKSARDYGNRMEQILTDLITATRAKTAKDAHVFFENSCRAQALNRFNFSYTKGNSHTRRAHASTYFNPINFNKP